MDELGIKHKKIIPLWPSVKGKRRGGATNKSLLKAMRAGHAEGKPWQRELQKYLLACRSTPHTSTGVSPAELLYGGRIRTKIKALRRKERYLVLQISRHETRMLNINREVLIVIEL